MKKIFDDNIANRLNRLEVDLPPNDWDVLLAKMPAKKRRAIPIWYYVSAASVVLLLGFGSLFMLYNDSPRGNSRELTAKVVSDSNIDAYSLSTSRVTGMPVQRLTMSAISSSVTSSRSRRPDALSFSASDSFAFSSSSSF